MKGMDQCTFVPATKLMNFITFKLISYINVQNNDILLEKRKSIPIFAGSESLAVFPTKLVNHPLLSMGAACTKAGILPQSWLISQMLMKVLFWKNLSIFLTISTGLIQSSCPCVSDTSPWSTTMRKAKYFRLTQEKSLFQQLRFALLDRDKPTPIFDLKTGMSSKSLTKYEYPEPLETTYIKLSGESL